MYRPAFSLAGLFLFVALGSLPLARGEAPKANDLAFFENKIRPVLVKHCYECHAADSAELGGKLLLDSRSGMQKGGESGPAIVSGKPDESLLVQALRYDGVEMPPEKPLPETVVNDFIEWIRRGAADPRNADAVPPAAEPKVQSDLWSLQPVQNPPLPAVQHGDWPRDPLDRFVLARIEAAQLSPTRDADSRTLIRRLSYDLTGLPPEPQQVEQFARAHARDGAAAVEQLVDNLLASPQFGERWGRHWLDVARYAESNGNDGLSRNPTFPHAWRYRDYVISALNADTPYDRFLTEQIAGDLLPEGSPEQRDRHLVATGFLALAAKPAKAMNTNFDMDVVADQIDVVGRGLMGFSISCARCHDHKFDPIPTRDYYAMAGVFTSTETMWGTAASEKLTAPKTDLHVLQAAPHVPPPADFVETVLVLESNTGKPKPVPPSDWPVGTPLAMGVRDRAKPADCKINLKGESQKLGEAVPRGFLSALELEASSPIQVDPKQSGRLQLAQWVTSVDHPLTPRVMVNRIWLHLFGQGIVRTPDDFGVYGERPSHPLLLDHLASRFVAEGWSIKRLIRAIVLSRTYQLQSDAEPSLIQADSQNLLLARHDRRRLDAESLRDSMLQVSGQLDPQPGDGSIIRHRDILVNLAGNLHQPSRHRSVYLCYLRSSPPPELAAFNLPDFTTVTGQRDESTVPGQALHLFNNPFVIEQANAFARVVMQASAGDPERVQAAFQRALNREPRPAEQEQAVALVQAATAELESEEQAWASFCQALLMASEFRYLD
ncbi:PSD1 and planctomycete cytochrome C domain-containing protein [Lignipirellula cremea]|uniref:Planctomycete cytochrome C n=1 Tax=Lignipirellula cremea TaxID=2528010 RepID=A0A518DLF7_9BACT|nr:PSD1 and planctomycete cytochrome C domain-containing protein [Lignipirellula cremea]QDU92670.1 Planctomycete cytochrome C [Lignipirellula cremea]